MNIYGAADIVRKVVVRAGEPIEKEAWDFICSYINEMIKTSDNGNNTMTSMIKNCLGEHGFRQPRTVITPMTPQPVTMHWERGAIVEVLGHRLQVMQADSTTKRLKLSCASICCTRPYHLEMNIHEKHLLEIVNKAKKKRTPK